jgi:hypothetical protein
LAILGVATIAVHYNNEIQRQVVSKGQDVRELKEKICAHWQVDQATVLLKTGRENGRFLGYSEKILDIFLSGYFELFLIPKSEAALADTSEIKFVFSDSDFPIVKAGKREKLLEWLLNAEYPNANFLEEFMMTFRSFMEPTELLQYLVDNYSNLNAPVPQQTKIIDIVRFWIKEYPTDFFKSTESSRKLLGDLHEFITRMVMKHNRSAGIELTRLYALMVIILLFNYIFIGFIIIIMF